MINPIRSDLLVWIQASIGWAVLATRVATTRPIQTEDTGQSGPALKRRPVRLRATISIDVEARDDAEAERVKAAVTAEHDRLRRAYPAAILEFTRRRPRTTRPAQRPTHVVSPYLDD